MLRALKNRGDARAYIMNTWQVVQDHNGTARGHHAGGRWGWSMHVKKLVCLRIAMLLQAR